MVKEGNEMRKEEVKGMVGLLRFVRFIVDKEGLGDRKEPKTRVFLLTDRVPILLSFIHSIGHFLSTRLFQ